MNPRVHRAADGHLYLIGGSNDVLRLYTDDGFAQAVDLAAWRVRLEARAAFFHRLGIPWAQVLAPEKLSITGDAVLADLVGPGANPPGARLLATVGHKALVYPRGYLREQAGKGYPVYPRTDSHWTAAGALCAFQWLAPTLGLHLDFAPVLALEPYRLSYRGDLWNADFPDLPPDTFSRYRMPAQIRRIAANELVELKERENLENAGGLHVGSYVAFRNDASERPERLVLFGSSFSEYRPECSLLTFLAALFFREVHFVWSSDLDTGFIERLAPDIALIEMPERFLTECPTDRFDLAAHAAHAVAQWTAARHQGSANGALIA